MRTHIEQYIWSLLEELDVDIENNNEAFEKCEKCIDNIIGKYDKYINQKENVICNFCDEVHSENVVKICSICQSKNNI